MQEQKEREELIKFRLDFWHTHQCCLGTRGLRAKLRKEDGISVGRKLIKRYMDEMGIYAVYPKPNLSTPRDNPQDCVNLQVGAK